MKKKSKTFFLAIHKNERQIFIEDKNNNSFLKTIYLYLHRCFLLNLRVLKNKFSFDEKQTLFVTASKHHSPAAGATQGYGVYLRNVTFLVLPTFAQQSTSEIVNLSLEDCIQLAYKKNNNLQITLLNESANQEIYKQSKLERLPNLNASLGETFTHSDSNGSNWNYDTYTP